jgi:hypothetical protein
LKNNHAADPAVGEVIGVKRDAKRVYKEIGATS